MFESPSARRIVWLGASDVSPGCSGCQASGTSSTNAEQRSRWRTANCMADGAPAETPITPARSIPSPIQEQHACASACVSGDASGGIGVRKVSEARHGYCAITPGSELPAQQQALIKATSRTVNHQHGRAVPAYGVLDLTTASGGENAAASIRAERRGASRPDRRSKPTRRSLQRG